MCSTVVPSIGGGGGVRPEWEVGLPNEEADKGGGSGAGAGGMFSSSVSSRLFGNSRG